MKLKECHFAAVNHLKHVLRTYPDAPTIFERARKWFDTERFPYVYSCMHVNSREDFQGMGEQIAEQWLSLEEKDRMHINTFSSKEMLSAYIMSTWNKTKAIYDIDDEVKNVLYKMDNKNKIDHSVFFGLPEWCIYVPTPELSFNGYEVQGFYVMLGYYSKEEKKGFLTDEVQLLFKLLMKNKDFYGISVPLKGDVWETIETLVPEDRGIREEFLATLRKLINLTLYICSKNTEAASTQVKKIRHFYKKGKVKTAIFEIKEVQVRVGSKFVSNPFQYVYEGSNESTGRSVTPHIRRAHWHGYWTGPRSGKQKFELKWIPPTFVGGAPETARVRES